MIEPDKIVTLDFETYFDADYSLKKLATSEYIRDDRFKAQCVGIKMGTNDVLWIPDKHVEEALRSIDWGTHALLAHHVQFDGFILTDRFGCTPAYYLDTLSMGRGLHSVGMGASLDALAQFYRKGNKLPDILDQTKGVWEWPPELMQAAGTYCAVDTQLCFEIYQCMIDKFCQSELDLIHETCRMFIEPVLHLDVSVAKRALALEKDNRRKKIEAADRDPADLSSNDKFADVLRNLGVEPPMKISPTTGEQTYAFAKSDAGFQELEIHEDEAVRAIIEARKAVKSTIGVTRAQRLLDEYAREQPIPVYLKYYGAHTGRWSAGNKMNLQNLPRIYPDDPDSGLLRKSLIAPPGYVLCVADSSQIEARTLAWLSGDQEVVDLFAAGEDVYKIMAAKIYQKCVDKVSKRERFVGKVAVLGLGYGMGWKKFLATITLGLMGPKMAMTGEEAKKVVDTYRSERHVVKNFWYNDCESMLRYMLNDMDGDWGVVQVVGKENKIYLPNGMYLEYPGLSETSDGYVYFNYENADLLARGYSPNMRHAKKIYGGLLTENITQGLARIIIGEQLLAVAKEYRVVTTTHDELVSLVREERADPALDFMIDTMRVPPVWAQGVPLDAEGGFAREYSK